MAFWSKHPKLESIELGQGQDEIPLFREPNVTEAEKFLPRLHYLRASLADANALYRHLPQLCLLDIANFNAPSEVWILMWGNGGNLGSLKSLTIRTHSKVGHGTLPWDPDVPNAIRTDPRWLQAIAEACPALEKLALIDDSLCLNNYIELLPAIQLFSHLRQFYYGIRDRCLCRSLEDTYTDKTMMKEARAFFEACQSLFRAGIIEGKSFKAVRNQDGSVRDVALDFGPGILVGRDNWPSLY